MNRFATVFLLLMMSAACASPTEPEGLPETNATTPAELAKVRFYLGLARNSEGRILPETWGNHKLGLTEQYVLPDSGVSILLRERSCYAENDPDPSTAFKDWQADMGNVPGGRHDSPLTQWGPVKVCNGEFDFEILIITFDRRADNPLRNNLTSLVIEPAGAAHVTRGRVKGRVADLPLR